MQEARRAAEHGNTNGHDRDTGEKPGVTWQCRASLAAGDGAPPQPPAWIDCGTLMLGRSSCSSWRA